MDIVSALRQSDRGMNDDELAAALGVDRQEVIRRCRRLAFQGLVIREEGSDGAIVNRLDSARPGSSGDGRLYFEDHISIERR